MDNIEALRSLPIGFMDSGLGGLSVLKEAIRLMPNEDYIYYGDSANAPYGTKSEEKIRLLTFAVVEKLIDYGIKGLVIACNTATASAVRPLRDKYPDLPIVGIEPAIKPAALSTEGGTILVMATPMTIAMDKYHLLLSRFEDRAKIVSVPCAGLMEFVEEGDLDKEDLTEYFKEHLSPYLSPDTETIVLGCTHYPFIRPQLRAFLNSDHIRIIDGSLGTAKEIRRRLMEKGLLKEGTVKGRITIENSSNLQEMLDRSKELLNRKL